MRVSKDSRGNVVTEVGGGAVKCVDIPNQIIVSIGGIGVSKGGLSGWVEEGSLVEVK